LENFLADMWGQRLPIDLKGFGAGNVGGAADDAQPPSCLNLAESLLLATMRDAVGKGDVEIGNSPSLQGPGPQPGNFSGAEAHGDGLGGDVSADHGFQDHFDQHHGDFQVHGESSGRGEKVEMTELLRRLETSNPHTSASVSRALVLEKLQQQLLADPFHRALLASIEAAIAGRGEATGWLSSGSYEAGG